jgi:FtsH-binding integral membrane protein
MKTENKRLTGIILGTLSVLLIPYVAMHFTKEVNWELNDFMMMGVLLISFGLLCELVLRFAKTTKLRFLLCGTVIIVFFLLWAELAVGIFGSPIAGS